jgi:hypothetical protein
MIIDWTKGAIQQVATTISRRIWSWAGISEAAPDKSPFQIETGHAYVSGGDVGTAYVSGGAAGHGYVSGGDVGQING